MTNVSESGPAQVGPTAASATGASADTASAATVDVSIRRAPKISVFLILGALVGFLGTLILTALQPVDPAIGFAALFGYFCIYGIPAGVVLGAIVAVVFDRVSSHTAKIVPAERMTVEEPELPERSGEIGAAQSQAELTSEA